MHPIKTIKLTVLALIAFISLLLSGCCPWHKPANPNDPYETYNRHMFTVNEKLDDHIFKPTAKLYKFMLYPQVRTGVTNFYRNLDTTSIIANDLLQGDFYNAMGDSWRIFINSTLGIAGIFDVAGDMKTPLPYHYNDFGLTMARWGIKKSEYFILPVLGPSTARDTLGIFVDYYAFSPISRISPAVTARYPALGVYFINTRANLLDYQHVLEVAALDPYVFQRNAYLQRRQYLIKKMEDNIQAQHEAEGRSGNGYPLKPTHSWQDKPANKAEK